MSRKDLKIYFCGSIRGGRADQELYRELISFMKTKGVVLTEHIGEVSLQADFDHPDTFIYSRDMEWLQQSDFVVAEVSTPSLGVGFEIASAICMKKKILCLSKASKHAVLSAMISGCPELVTAVYSDPEEAKEAINRFIA